MTRYLKAITAFFTALGTWGVTALADDAITNVELFGLCGVVVATVAVFGVPNERPVSQPYDPDISEREPDAGPLRDERGRFV